MCLSGDDEGRYQGQECTSNTMQVPSISTPGTRWVLMSWKKRRERISQGVVHYGQG